MLVVIISFEKRGWLTLTDIEKGTVTVEFRGESISFDAYPIEYRVERELGDVVRVLRVGIPYGGMNFSEFDIYLNKEQEERMNVDGCFRK